MTWRSLLIVYPEINVRLGRRRFHYRASAQEIADATESFRAFPGLASRLTKGAARVEVSIVQSEHPLGSVTKEQSESYWPSPDDTRRELDHFARPGSFESVFIFWPANDRARNTSVPCRGWGLGMGASDWTNGATYAVVSNAPTSSWTREAPGEVWLHEWLHGVCHHFAERGHAMPERDADGAELHGYARSETDGWTSYYHDLMSGKVERDGQRLGIPLSAWGKASAQPV